MIGRFSVRYAGPAAVVSGLMFLGATLSLILLLKSPAPAIFRVAGIVPAIFILLYASLFVWILMTVLNMWRRAWWWLAASVVPALIPLVLWGAFLQACSRGNCFR